MSADFLPKKKFALTVLCMQALFILLFAVFTEYKINEARPPTNSSALPPNFVNSIDGVYPLFMDVHSMMFLGFGFLMAFLARYGYSSIGLNFLLGAFVLQWATLSLGLFGQYPEFNKTIALDINSLLTADFAAAAIMITFGAVLGKVSIMQLMVIAFVEIIIFSINEMIGVKIFKAVDIGGAIFVHTFGAYFGVALTRALASRTRHARKGSKKEGATYMSDILAMIGSIILWLYWPSFNGALGTGDQRHRVIINTYYSLSACVVVTFGMSVLLSKEHKLDMVHVQNATLAGGVAVGTTADFLIEPWGAMLLGSVAAVISVTGYVHIQPFLQEYLHIHDTCGVHNLHGMPGVLAAIASAAAVVIIDTGRYGSTLENVLPSVAEGRAPSQQAGFQLAALVVTLVFAVAGGTVTGWFINVCGGALDPVPDAEPLMFDDAVIWHLSPDSIEPEPQKSSSYNAHASFAHLKRSMTQLTESDVMGATNAREALNEKRETEMKMVDGPVERKFENVQFQVDQVESHESAI